ncbi:MAG TPA: TolC family protein [Bacteroidota bacterium]|nr:TolC family protein [Bacteroidota bacterium]
MSQKMITGILCLFLGTGIAVSQTGKVLTLDAAVQLALERNVQVIQARNRLEGSHAQTRAAYGGLLPTLSASGSFSRQQQWQEGGVTLINGVPYQYPPGFSANNNYNAGIRSSLTLFDGFANTSDISRAQANASSSQFSVRRTEQTVIIQTHVLFLGIARAYQLLGVADDNLKRSRRQLERITESNKVGAVALADVYRQRVQAGNDELAVIQAQSNYESSKADLIAYLGVEYDEKAWIIDVSQAPTDIDTTEFGELNHRYDNFDNLVATGVEQRPDHQATGEALNAASSSVTIARAGHLPTVSAGGSYGYSNPKLDKLTDNRSLSLNLSVSLPIFNGFGTSNAVEQARIQEMNAREDMEQSKRQIAVDVRKALLNLEQAEKRLIVTKTSVFSAEMDRKIAEEKYNLGAGTLLDMLVATANYTNAVSGKVNSIFDFLLAKKSMEYALGSITQ